MTRLPVMCAVNNPPSARKPITSTAPAVMANTAGSKNLAGQLTRSFIEFAKSRFQVCDFETCAGRYWPDDACVNTAKACETKNHSQSTSAITVGLITFIPLRYLAPAFNCDCVYGGFCDVTQE